MAQIDKLKEEIGWLKVIFAILIATDISLIAWLAQNYRKATPLLLTIGLVVAFLVTLIIINLRAGDPFLQVGAECPPPIVFLHISSKMSYNDSTTVADS